ncbi:SpoIIE family protein phosphatase [Algivirga pacifica]|uniref:Serine phosphatase RsbU, regulator of sigma subunit n=1 Tax=Algivirga pacifica TaxID=1162670 RepID=A0ABP9DDQ7_9BACT
MRLKLLFFLLSTLFTIYSFGQGGKAIQGVVTDDHGRKLPDVQVKINDFDPVMTTKDGTFYIPNILGETSINTVVVSKERYSLGDWAMMDDAQVKIMMVKMDFQLRGKVVDHIGNPLTDVEVKLKGEQFPQKVRTDARGEFVLHLPPYAEITKESNFLIDGMITPKEGIHIGENGNSVILTKPQLLVAKTEEKVSPEIQQKVVEKRKEVELQTEPDISPVLVVVVYEEDISTASNVSVFIDGKEYKTNQHGEFEILADSINNSEVSIPSHSIENRRYDFEDNYLFLYIKDENKEKKPEEVHLEYKENFHLVFNALEAEKQLLQENGQYLRKEIMKISERLERDAPSNMRKKELEAYLQRLQESLIDNDLAFENAQYKTNKMLNRMRSQIMEKDEEIEQKEIETQEVKRSLYISVAVIVVFLIMVLVLVILSRKFKKQRDELDSLSKSLNQARKEVVKVHEETLAVTDIGQRFTALLDFEQHIDELQEGVNLLLDASVFGIGIYHEQEQVIEFYDQGYTQKEGSSKVVRLDDQSSLAGWSFRNEVELIINDLKEEYHLYIPEGSIDFSEPQPRSMIFMPLIIGAQPVGLIKMQSMEKNAYKQVSISNLKSLASYAAIAVANHKVYKELKQKNRHITDGIRYAQTIQFSILPPFELIQKGFQDAFLLYQPKDLVSGDFYWYNEVKTDKGKNIKYLAVVDCTGHGVPGAFMSMIGNTLLNEIINFNGVTDTVEIMNLLNEGVQTTLRQERRINDDGMDVGLCAIEETASGMIKVSYTGAKRPLYYYSNSEKSFDILYGDVKSIGSIHRVKKQFTTHNLYLQKGDMLFLTTDGYADQNNPFKEKIGSVKLREILEKNIGKSGEEQKQALEKALKSHMAGVEQRDDITILGVRI